MGKPSSNQDPLIGQVVGGRFEIVRLIGKGGMGNIYEVLNTRVGRSFALKTLTGDAAGDPEVLQRFRREADVIARIKHPNIVEVIDWETLADGSPAMVMEYLQGEDLAKRIEGGPLDWPFMARVADQVLAALSIAHANGVVHRDLKPQNIFLAQDDSGDEKVKLLDFGVSKVRDSKSLVTTDARLLGTPAYMSPEQAEGRASDVGTHSDVWAIGTILYEMATGELAYDAPSLPSILYKICHGSAQAVNVKRPDAPAAFVQLVSETLVREVDQRISDATVLRVRLREALRGISGVHFADTLPSVRLPSSSGKTPGGRRKRFTDAMTDTVGAITPPAGNLAIGTPVSNLGTQNTIAAGVATPSMITRRKFAPIALIMGVLAVVMIVIAIFIATRDKAEPRPLAKPADQAVPSDAAIAAEAPIETPDAAVAVAVEPPKVDPPVVKPRDKTVVKKDPPKQDPPKQDPPKQDPPKQDPPKQDPPKRKQCAKDDMECLYGDGT